MLLRIIDESKINDDIVQVRIEFETEKEQSSYIVENFASLKSESFIKSLRWYYFNFPMQTGLPEPDRGVGEKILRHGQYCGDALLGEDHELLKYLNRIAAVGYDKLEVSIESENARFFDELWESCIFHDAKYVLSSCVKHFSRKCLPNKIAEAFPGLHYDLKVESPTNEQVQRLLQSSETEGQKKNESPRPLNIAAYVSRKVGLPGFADEGYRQYQSSNILQLSFNAFAQGGVVQFFTRKDVGWKSYSESLVAHEHPIHIFHYDGPIITDAGVDYFVFANDKIPAADVMQLLASNKINVCCIDSRFYLTSGQVSEASHALTRCAALAHAQGIGNLLGLNYSTHPWISTQIFEALYGQLALGHELGQAVVEVRKLLQAQHQQQLGTYQPIAFCAWPLLTHYSVQKVYFFGAGQSPADPNTSQRVDVIRQKLFGFRSDMLPPLVANVGDGNYLDLLEALFHAEKNMPVFISGPEGGGKTHMVHLACAHMAQVRLVSFAFYFNFSQETYTVAHIEEMLAPVLDVEPSKVQDALRNIRCCFVFDNFIQLDDAHLDHVVLNEFIQKNVAQHAFVIIGKPEFQMSGWRHILCDGLCETEKNILIAQQLDALHWNDEKLEALRKDNYFSQLLEKIGANPWLIQKALPLLLATEIQSVVENFGRFSISADADLPVTHFYQWQWAGLPEVWQRFLLLCMETRGILLEMLMVAADPRQSFTPAKNLMSLLGDENAQISEGLKLLSGAAMLSHFPHGRMVDNRCMDFLSAKREQLFNHESIAEIRLTFSKVLCQGITLLAQHVLKTPNPQISNNLIINRRNWVEHFEALWFAQDYTGFIRVKTAFEHLMREVKLDGEMREWSLDLLNRTPVSNISSDSITAEQKLCWLSLAINCLADKNSIENDEIRKGAEQWSAWHYKMNADVSRDVLPIYHQVSMFLDAYYGLSEKWFEAIEVNEKLLTLCRQHQAWQKVIFVCRTISEYYRRLGNKEKSREYEDIILNEIPYEESPVGYKAQQLVEILLMRLQHNDIENFEALLTLLKNDESSQRFAEVINGIEADMYFQQGNYLEALPHYGRVWVKALQAGHPAHIDQLKRRLIEIETHIGKELFSNHLTDILPAGVLKPDEYAGAIH